MFAKGAASGRALFVFRAMLLVRHGLLPVSCHELCRQHIVWHVGVQLAIVNELIWCVDSASPILVVLGVRHEEAILGLQVTPALSAGRCLSSLIKN